MSDKTPSQGMKAFATIWIGQLVSLLGSGLTSFALGIWVLERSQSVTQYTLIILCASLPGVLVAPFAGALVDRWDRKWVMFFTDLGPGLITVTYAILLWHGQLHVWHIYIGAALNAMFGSFQWPAYISSITMLVDRSQYGRVNGMLDFGQAGDRLVLGNLDGL